GGGGAVLGVGLALWGLVILRAVAPAALPRIDEAGVDASVLAFTALAAFARQLKARLEALPGVDAVTAVGPLPLDGTVANSRWGTEAAAADPSLFQQAKIHVVLPGYFDTFPPA